MKINILTICIIYTVISVLTLPALFGLLLITTFFSAIAGLSIKESIPTLLLPTILIIGNVSLWISYKLKNNKAIAISTIIPILYFLWFWITVRM